MTNSEFQGLRAQIVAGGFTAEQIRELYDALKFARGQAERRVKRSLNAGDEVKFMSRRGEIRGKVVRMLTKNVQVREISTGLLWRVTPSLLTTV